MAFRKLKPTANEKAQRNKDLYAYFVTNDCTFKELGEKFDITTARAYFLVRRFERDNDLPPCRAMKH